MNQLEFMSKNEVERVKSINQMLREPGVEKIADVASMLGMSSSTLSKKMTERDYTYSRSLKQYVLRDEKQDGISKEDVMKYLQENHITLKALIEREQRSDKAVLVLSPEVVTKGEYVVKNTRIPVAISDQFAQLCADKYAYLKLQDTLAQAIWEFVIKYR